MTIHPIPRQTAGGTARRPTPRRRAPRALNLFEPPADERTAAAMDDAAQAEQLVETCSPSSTPGWSRPSTATMVSATRPPTVPGRLTDD
jgi:hypothetical protein